ncbi:MAG: hypothetical protein FD180_383 [Planctomycetota bacterium]|nr:MAG: hypothetical protein FD180_383 [Planctomycetota bacterium]
MRPAGRSGDGRLLVASDTNILINFLAVTRMNLLVTHTEFKFVVTAHTREELTVKAQRDQVEQAIAAGSLEEAIVQPGEEMKLYSELAVRIGSGESAAIAVACARGWSVATDEKGRTRREIVARLGETWLLTTPGILLRCVLNGTISVAEADAIKDQLAVRRFIMPFRSFSERIPKKG